MRSAEMYWAQPARLANAIQAAYYPLDESRDTARLILSLPDGSRQVLDFAGLRGPDLESDLRLRDFTMNAMALPLHALNRLVDPLGGLEDLRRGVAAGLFAKRHAR